MPELKVDEKTGVSYRKWNAPSPKAVLLLVHGLGAHSQRWGFLADFFLTCAYSSYAIELRGFGRTKELKGDIESFNIYLDDVRSLWGIIKEEYPDKKVFLVGESMGALIAFLAAAQSSKLWDGIILLSPVFRSRLKMPALNYLKIFFSLFYNPRKQIHIPFDSQMCTRDVDYQKVMDADPLEHRLATVRLLFNIVSSQIRAQYLRSAVYAPILFLLSGKDELADAKASQKFFRGLKTEDKEIILYHEMRHALSIELEREKVFKDILKWTERRI